MFFIQYTCATQRGVAYSENCRSWWLVLIYPHKTFPGHFIKFGKKFIKGESLKSSPCGIFVFTEKLTLNVIFSQIRISFVNKSIQQTPLLSAFGMLTYLLFFLLPSSPLFTILLIFAYSSLKWRFVLIFVQNCH